MINNLLMANLALYKINMKGLKTHPPYITIIWRQVDADLIITVCQLFERNDRLPHISRSYQSPPAQHWNLGTTLYEKIFTDEISA